MEGVEEVVGQSHHLQMKVVEHGVEVVDNHQIPKEGVSKGHQNHLSKGVVETKVFHASLCVILEVVVVKGENHKGLGAPKAAKEEVQSHDRLAYQSVPLGEVLPSFALQAQGEAGSCNNSTKNNVNI